MTIAEIVFYLLAVAAIVSAIGTVTVPNVVHAALFLIVSLLAVAGFYILLSSEFLALTQVLIYGGAVATIILFGLMLTRGGAAAAGGRPPAANGLPASLRRWLIMVGLLTAVLDSDWPRDVNKVTLVPIDQIGRVAVPRLAAALRGCLGRPACRPDRRRGDFVRGRGGGVEWKLPQRRYRFRASYSSPPSSFLLASTACSRDATRCRS